ncbi:MAG: radical SAM protein [Bacillota bacterium]
MDILKNCMLCPRKCGINRYEGKGCCGADENITAAKAFLHQWEEPCISGENGSGTIFFTCCNLRCIFCQNYEISQNMHGKSISIERLAEIMLELQGQGAENINFVTPTPYILHIVEAVSTARRSGLTIPTVYNTSGYETIEALKLLEGIIDIYLPDLKYYSERYSKRYSNAEDYFMHASNAVLEMTRQVGLPVFDERGIMKKGVLVRHMIMPDMLEDSKSILRWIRDNIGEKAYISLMSQYTPLYRAKDYEEINRKLDDWEYEYIVDYFFKLGLENGFIQEYSSASSEYVPDFNLSGI